MIVARAVVALLALTVALPAAAQTHAPYGSGWSALDRRRHSADQHRLDMDRLRIDADRRQIEARQHQIESRMNALRIQAARQPDIAPPPAASLRSLEEERAARVSATARREEATAAMGQIDAWLDRAPPPRR